MFFKFHDWNHCDQGKAIIGDIIHIMGHQLMALGHAVGWPTGGPRFEEGDNSPGRLLPGTPPEFVRGPGAVNVLIESFADEGCLEIVERAYRDGARFLFVATEKPAEDGFNGGYDPGMCWRQEAFAAAARYADGILHLVRGDDVTEWYARHAPSAYAELGYAPSLVYDGPDVEPDYDFGFYGKWTHRRGLILIRLSEHGKVLVEERLIMPRQERDAHMRRAKVIVQIRAEDQIEYPSSTRCVTAICMGRPVVAEYHPAPGGWDEVAYMAESGPGFLSAARAIAGGNWRSLHARQLDRLAEKFPPEFCIGRPLRQIGIL